MLMQMMRIYAAVNSSNALAAGSDTAAHYNACDDMDAGAYTVFQIDLEEYGVALDLARKYNLDSDLVYQRQWRNSPVSVTSIQDYLVSIQLSVYTV